MLNYEEFRNRLRLDLVDYGGAEVFEFTQINKNNGKVDAIIVKNINSERIRPTLYIKPLYEKYYKTLDYEGIIDTIVKFKEEEIPEEFIDGEFTALFKDKEELLNNVQLMLINYEMNKEQLINLPYRQIMDLAIVYCIHKSGADGVNFTVKINKDVMHMLDFNEADLWKHAYENTVTLSRFVVRSLPEILHNLTGVIDLPEMETDDAEMYVLTNEATYYGAIAMIYPELMQEVSKRLDSDLIIIPSSIHEVILLPTRITQFQGLSYLEDMVREVNNTCVQRNEILSYSIYYYDRDDNNIIKLGSDDNDEEEHVS